MDRKLLEQFFPIHRSRVCWRGKRLSSKDKRERKEVMMPTLSRKESRIITITKMAGKSEYHCIRSSWRSLKRNKNLLLL